MQPLKAPRLGRARRGRVIFAVTLALLAAVLLYSYYERLGQKSPGAAGGAAGGELVEALRVQALRLAGEAEKLTHVPGYGREAALIAVEARRIAANPMEASPETLTQLRLQLSRIREQLREAVNSIVRDADKVLSAYTSERVPAVVRATLDDLLRDVRWRLAIIEKLLGEGDEGDAYIEALRLATDVRRLAEALPVYLEAARIVEEAAGLQGVGGPAARLAVEAAEIASSVLASYPPEVEKLARAARLLAEAEKLAKNVGGAGAYPSLQLLLANAEAAVSAVDDAGVYSYLHSRLWHLRRAIKLIGPDVTSPALVDVELDARQVALLASTWRLYMVKAPEAYTSRGWLVFSVAGTVDAVAIYSPYYTEPQLVIYTVPVNSSQYRVSADIVEMTPFTTKIYINASKLVEKLKPGRYYAVLLSPKPGGRGFTRAYIVPLNITKDSIKVGEVQVLEPIVAPCYSIDAYRATILCSYTPSTLAALRHVLFNDTNPAMDDALWLLAGWLSSHLNYTRAGALGLVHSPLETVERGGGVCRDFAVLSAAALLAVGYPNATIVVSLSARHAFTLARLGGSIVVVDRGLPPVELADYLEYVLGPLKPSTTIAYTVYMDEGLPHVVECIGCRLEGVDSYPGDTIPSSLYSSAVFTAVYGLNATPAPQLAPVITYNLPGVAWRELSVVGPAGRRVPVEKLYSPLFHRQWLRLLSGEVRELLHGLGVGRGWSAWAVVADYNGSLVFKAYALPPYTPRAGVLVYGDKLVVDVRAADRLVLPLLHIDFYSIESGGAEACLTVIPPFTIRVTLLPVAYADAAACHGPLCVVVVDLGRLRGQLKRCRGPLLVAVVYNETIISAELLGPGG